MSKRTVTISKGTRCSIDCYDAGNVNEPVITVEIRVPLSGPCAPFYREVDDDGNLVLTFPDVSGD